MKFKVSGLKKQLKNFLTMFRNSENKKQILTILGIFLALAGIIIINYAENQEKQKVKVAVVAEGKICSDACNFEPLSNNKFTQLPIVLNWSCKNDCLAKSIEEKSIPDGCQITGLGSKNGQVICDELPAGNFVLTITFKTGF